MADRDQEDGGVLRPVAKTLIKSSMVSYRETLSEIGEMATDLVAKARGELDQEGGWEAAQDHHTTA